MTFDHPQVLFLLWLVPLVAYLLARAERKRRQAIHFFLEPPMAARLAPSLGGPRPWIKNALTSLGLAMLILAMARPRLGIYFENAGVRGVDVVILLDVSKSMLSEDVAPSRLARAKSDIKDLLAKLEGDRVGLVLFAGKPVVAVPLTTDSDYFLAELGEAGPGSAPRGGTNIGDAIRKSLECLPQAADRDQAIVVLTDGEDQDRYAVDAAEQAAKRNVRIFTVGLGDPTEGGRIPIRDEANRVTYMQHEGKEVWSKMDESLLQKIARATGGAYVPARTRAYDLGQVYEEHLSKLTQGEMDQGLRPRKRDRFQWFVALGLIFLFADLMAARTTGRSPTEEALAA